MQTPSKDLVANFSSKIMEIVVYTHDAASNDTKVASVGFLHKTESLRKRTMTTSSGTVGNSGSVTHLRIKSSCLAVSTFTCLLNGDAGIPLFVVGHCSGLLVRIRLVKNFRMLVLAFEVALAPGF